MSTAIVTGATGILGREIVRELCSRPVEWSKVYTLSRSKKEDFGTRSQHVHVDLSAAAEDLAQELKDTKADYVFFAAYLQMDSDEENTRVNGDMLATFCKALEINGHASCIKRFVLVCGAKQYGVALGRPKIPMIEDDPWMPEPPFPPNFYYRQQHILHDFSKKHGVDWNVTYPSEVLGFAKGNLMNFASAAALYAAVSKEMGTELVFPGSEDFYQKVTVFTDAGLHARFCRWAALEPKAANEAFNVVNGDVESWMNLWPRMAKYFELTVPADQFLRPTPLASERPLVPNPPISVRADAIGLEGRTPQSYVRSRINLVKWSQQQDVQAAWNKLSEREGLDSTAFEKASWAFADFAWGRDYNSVLSMSKARKLGWTGYCDTWDNFESIFDVLKEQRIIPHNFVGKIQPE